MTAADTTAAVPLNDRSAPPVSGGRREGFEWAWSEPRGFLGVVRTIDNIPIARRYMATGFAFFLLGGVQALLMRIQLGTPENTFLDAETYNQLFTMHGTTMMFLFVIPFIEALANYMLPLILGTRDLPFPRLTALSYWTYLFGGIFLYSSFLFGAAPDGGWFSYVPLNDRTYSPGLNMDFWDIGLSVAEVSAMGVAAEMIVAMVRMRAPGMSLDRMPLFAWAMLVTGVMVIFGFTPLIVGTVLLELDRKGLTSFFVPSAGGEPLLWQHLFWVFGHPEVYIMFVPAVGIVSQVVQTFTGRPIVSHTLMVLGIVATGFISFGLWVHHMFTTGLSTMAMSFFTAASLVIAIPNGIQVASWIATMWSGRPVWRVPLLFVIGFLVIFLLGGITGVMVAAVPFDWQAHDSYFVVAHFHYVLIGGVVFPLFAGLYYWLPKILGRMMSERAGKWSFWIMFAGFNVAFFPMHIVGLMGMPRRVYTYQAGLGWDIPNLISTIGAFVFASGVLLTVGNLLRTLRKGPKAPPDPWGGDTLEWSVASPPPSAQFAHLPVVRGRHPLWEQDTLAAKDPETARLLEPLESAPTRWRGALIVEPYTGRPMAIAHMPRESVWPFVLSVAFVLLFAAALVERPWLFYAGGALAAIGLAGWFWPLETERVALEEIPTAPDDDRLPLAVGGTIANGWWGTIIFVLILATALATVVASYFYLAAGADGWPREAPAGPKLALAATGATIAAGIAAWGTLRAIRRGSATAQRIAATAASLLAIVALVPAVRVWRQGGYDAAASAYHSAVLAVVGFQWVLGAVVIVMLAVAAVWAWLAPRDPRGHGVAWNSALVCWFAGVSWAIALATLYLTPGLW